MPNALCFTNDASFAGTRHPVRQESPKMLCSAIGCRTDIICPSFGRLGTILFSSLCRQEIASHLKPALRFAGYKGPKARFRRSNLSRVVSSLPHKLDVLVISTAESWHETRARLSALDWPNSKSVRRSCTAYHPLLPVIHDPAPTGAFLRHTVYVPK